MVPRVGPDMAEAPATVCRYKNEGRGASAPELPPGSKSQEQEPLRDSKLLEGRRALVLSSLCTVFLGARHRALKTPGSLEHTFAKWLLHGFQDILRPEGKGQGEFQVLGRFWPGTHMNLRREHWVWAGLPSEPAM